MKRIALLLVFSFLVFSCKRSVAQKVAKKSKTTITTNSRVEVIPVSHATAIIKFGSEIIYLDPTGAKKHLNPIQFLPMYSLQMFMATI